MPASQGIKPTPYRGPGAKVAEPAILPVHSKKCEITPVKVNLGEGQEERYIVSMSLTLSELVALRGMLHEERPQAQQHRSLIAGNVMRYVRDALARLGIVL